MGNVTVKEQNTQPTPTSGYSKIYPKTDGKWYYKDDAGDEHEFAEAGSPSAHASTHKGGGSDVIDNATGSVAGLLSSSDKTKLDTIDSNADVTGSNAPQAHAASHQNGGGDEISVAGLSGVLADEQDAGSLAGIALNIDTPGRRDPLVYDVENDEWINDKLWGVSYGVVLIEDTTLTWEMIEDSYKFIPVNTEPQLPSHVGNGTVAYLNGISATTGDTYGVSDSGTLTAGSVPVVKGMVVMWYISAWIVVAAANVDNNITGGLMVVLSTTTPLISPYTDGTDDGKIIGFKGDDMVGVETSQDLTITLPDPADLPYNDGMIKGMYFLGKMRNGGTVTIVPGGTSGAFMDGLESVLLTKEMSQCTLAVVNAALASVWMRISVIEDYLQVRRAATWSATNFSTPTGMPFDTEDQAGNPDISVWDNPTNPSRLIAKFKSVYYFSGHINIDTTGGSTWVFQCWLRKNGTTEIPGSRIRTGNYQGEDMAATLSAIEVILEVDDYIEWMCEHTSLTGQIYSAAFTMRTTY